MPLTDQVEIPIRTCVIFFVIDTSGSMEGSNIGALNAAIEDFIPEIRKIADEEDVQIKIAVLGFSTGARWLTANGPVEVSQFNWESPVTGGATDLGSAYRALNEKLSSKAFMQNGMFAPEIFLIMDGDPTDDWKSALAELKQNNWFKLASKCAIAIGDDVDRDVLKEFTGTMELVLEIRHLDVLKMVLKQMIRAPWFNAEADVEAEDYDFELQARKVRAIVADAEAFELQKRELKTVADAEAFELSDPDTEREEW
jgi:uncharacterized protein YegL